MPCFHGSKPRLVDIVRRYGLQAMNCVLIGGLARNQVHWLSLFNSKPDAVCKVRERALCLPCLLLGGHVLLALEMGRMRMHAARPCNDVYVPKCSKAESGSPAFTGGSGQGARVRFRAYRAFSGRWTWGR